MLVSEARERGVGVGKLNVDVWCGDVEVPECLSVCLPPQPVSVYMYMALRMHASLACGFSVHLQTIVFLSRHGCNY
jgi:hypothetical protein